MSTVTDETVAHDPHEWESLVEIGRYPTLAQAQAHGLVVLAMREPCWVAETTPPGSFTLHTEVATAAQAAHELAEYEREQAMQNVPPAAVDDLLRYSSGLEIFAVWLLTLLGVFFWQYHDPTLVERAASSNQQIFGHDQWWRPFTALFLHADLPHLIGNVVSGLLFGSLVARSIGPLRGWLLIFACGALGNFLTAALTWPQSFVSLGASTAVFAALGILSGIGVTTQWHHRVRLPWMQVTAPVVAGLILLGWLGGGAPGDGTDVIGHVCGFVSGLTAGLVIGAFRAARPADVRPTA